MIERDTLPKLLMINFQRYGDTKVALRKKSFGIWQEYTWKDYYENVKAFSLGLVSLGLKREERVTVLGDNDPQWYWAEVAAQAAGAVAVGAFEDCTSAEIQYILDHSDTKFVVVRDQEQVDKILEVKDKCPNLKRVIYWRPGGIGDYDEPLLISFEDVQQLGRKYVESVPGLFEQNVEKGKGDDVAIICYILGARDTLKGARLSHKNLLFTSKSIAKVDAYSERDDYASNLSPAWVGEQMWGVGCGLANALTVNFPEAPETTEQDIRDVGPSIILYGFRQWESIRRLIHLKIGGAVALNRFFYNVATPVGYKMAELRERGQKVNIFWKSLYTLANLLVFRSLRDKLGLLRCRVCYTTDDVVSGDIQRFFHGIGVNLKNVYCTTETQGIAEATDSEVSLETMGRIYEGVEVRISGGNEILVRSDGVFRGYHKDPESSEKVLSKGWYHTGDVGRSGELGSLIYQDRLADLLETTDGTKVSPRHVEAKLSSSPYIRYAMLIGGVRRDYLTAIINIDFDNVAKWAEVNKITYTTFVDISQMAEVRELVKREVEKVNRNLPQAGRIRKFINLYEQLSYHKNELTRTGNLNRPVIEEHYRELIDSMYQDKEEFRVEIQGKSRDGKTMAVTATIKINSALGDS